MSQDIVAPPAHHSADIAALNNLAPATAGSRPVRSGAWSDAGTWGGVPAGGAVVIPAGLGVIIDAELSGALQSVRVDGCLEFARTVKTRLRTDLLYVAPGGEIWIGAPSSPIAAGVTAEISFPATGPINVTRDPNLLGKGFVSASKATIFGAKKTSRVRAAIAPLEGATMIALETAPSGWAVGDRLVLTGTKWVKFLADANGIKRANGAQDEELTITAINGASVTVTPALRFDHAGPRAEFMPYLVNFTRNIRFSTESAAAIPVHERAHSMFMSPQTVVRSAEFRDMGRTDKSRRAVSASSLSPPQSNSNVKGRYPLHLHKAGGHGANIGADIRNVAVWGSPGWGVAQHSSVALLFDNAVYNAFGAGFVAESGDEEGAWVSNIAIKSEGVAEIVKDPASIAAFDLARTGDGYWMQGRLLHLHRNVAAGMGGGIGFVFMNRGTDITAPDPITPEMLLQPATFRYANQAIDHPNLQQFTDNEVFASRLGYHVVKFSPRQPHDGRSVIDHFTAWEVEAGIEITYVSNYTIKNAVLIGSRQRPPTIGVDFGENTYDLSVVDSRIEDFNYGVNFSHLWTTTFGPAAYYVASNNSFANIDTATHINADVDDIILASAPPALNPSIAFSWGAALPMWTGANGFRILRVSGTKTDSAGSLLFPLTTNEFKFDNAGIVALLAKHGYYTLPDGRRVAVAPEHLSNRITGAIELTSFAFEIDPAFSVAGLSNSGVLTLGAAPPAPANDSAIVPRNSTVTIDALANDGAGGPFTLMGLTPARQGAAQIQADGRILYAPYPDFSGSDSFSYWLRASNGQIGKATVNITVQ